MSRLHVHNTRRKRRTGRRLWFFRHGWASSAFADHAPLGLVVGQRILRHTPKNPASLPSRKENTDGR